VIDALVWIRLEVALDTTTGPLECFAPYFGGLAEGCAALIAWELFGSAAAAPRVVIGAN
jgi:hypothetical protein